MERMLDRQKISGLDALSPVSSPRECEGDWYGEGGEE